MGRLIDADNLNYTCNADECCMITGCDYCQYNIITKDEIDSAPTVEAVSMENIDKMIADINNLNAPKTDTEYQDGFYDCEQMVLDIINKYCKGET